MTQTPRVDPAIQVVGGDVLAIKAAIKALGGDPEPLLDRHGLRNIQAEDWYSLQLNLDLLEDIRVSKFDFLSQVAIGEKIPDFVHWPPSIQTVEEAFGSIDTAYHMNHRGGDIGWYKSEL